MTPAARARASRLLWGLAEAAFALFLVAGLTTPSWRYGAFAWWPVARFDELAGGPVALGLLNFLPVLVAAAWLGALLLEERGRRAWTWGPFWITVPLLGLTILAAAGLEPSPFRRFFLNAGMLALAWLVYLYVTNARPRLRWPLAAVLIIQGTIAIGQFARQSDLGLVRFGELPLNPAFEGISVLTARGEPWLRAYGLTAHPNLLAAIMVAGLLFLLPTRGQWRGWGRAIYYAAATLGFAGLVLSFSRAGWLAFLCGALVFAVLWRPARASSKAPAPPRRPAQVWLRLALPILPALFLLVSYRDLVFSRIFALDTPTEAQSIDQRLHDIGVAIGMVEESPWTGVGIGNYTDAAEALNADNGRVHNVGLLVAAELGLPGFALWLWLMLAPLWVYGRKLRQGRDGPPSREAIALMLAPWAAMLVIDLFDTMLWLSSNWQTSILFSLLLANLVWPLALVEKEEEEPQMAQIAQIQGSSSAI